MYFQNFITLRENFFVVQLVYLTLSLANTGKILLTQAIHLNLTTSEILYIFFKLS